ncbi:hypothetical protein ACG33_04740 [Steroidobacter denitrificans]|uniref:Sugar transporter n=1 Tax=Steroidobacter denitrificans TaxID=465721 RepID=A0A127FA07_STEDE|nr:SLBB domain-containing protein [Steroidobacter denitrificans]AMN46420.1 hypothetical protein ACG33_04740 [Steroidobacter denitrificans]
MVRLKLSSFICGLAAALVLVVSGPAVPTAYAQTPTAAQMEAFKNLPADQQRAIMESAGRGGAANSRAQPDRQVEFPQTVMPLSSVSSEDAPYVDARTGEPRLKAGEAILFSVEIRRYERSVSELEEAQRRAVQQGVQPGTQGVGSGSGTLHASVSGTSEPKLLVRTAEEEQRLEEFRQNILRRNPYKLDRWGILDTPELGSIPLAGLTAEQATERLAAEVRLKDFVVRVTRLALEPIGTEALEPFGYELFAGMPSTFAPATDIPVPSEYVVGPGDTLEVQLLGNTKGRYSLVVGRDGRIDFPELGPIAVSGRRFEEVRKALEFRVSEQMLGTQASISIGELRSIRVFVLGEANVPGSYTVSGLSTITNALFVSGGIKKIGSLRNIQHKRNGKVIGTLDLYDLLLKGDTRTDARLLPGDVIFVPPVGPTVGLAGEVRRPAIYELKDEKTAAALLRLGGGFTPKADPVLATVERVNDQRVRITLDLDLTSAAGNAALLRNGDTLRIAAIRPTLENSVVLNGHVFRPGEYGFTPGMHITDVLRGLDELKPNADQHYVLIRRETTSGGRIQVLSADLKAALADPRSSSNLELAPRDQINVFDLETGRDRVIEPLMRELRLQARLDEPTPEVSVAGKVKVPGKYPLESGMRVSDLLRAGGLLDEAAFRGEAELTRYDVPDGASRRAQLVEIDLQRVRAGDPTADIALQPYDYLVVKEVPMWGVQEEVEIRGEVRFPGRYPIHRGETLRSLMQRAGGLTEHAFPAGAVLTREELKEREKRQLETLANRMEMDLAQLSIMSSQEAGIRDAGQTMSVGQSLLASLREAEPVGRLVIDLPRAARAAPGSDRDVILKNGDTLIVPRITQEVTVIGEVQSSTSHLYRNDLSRNDYIAMSGGLTPRADGKHIYIVRADGSVVTSAGNRWFRNSPDIQPGDTIVAPLDTERMRPLPFWTSVTQIIYHLAISVAAVNSF